MPGCVLLLQIQMHLGSSHINWESNDKSNSDGKIGLSRKGRITSASLKRSALGEVVELGPARVHERDTSRGEG